MFKPFIRIALVMLAQAPLVNAGTWTVIASFQGFNPYNGYGIEADGTYLYTVDSYIQQRINILTTTGSLAYSIPLPVNAHDLDFDGLYFWVAHGDRYCRRYTYSGSLLNSFLPGSLTPRGIAWDGTYIWLLGQSGSSYNIFRMNTAGSAYSSFPCPGGSGIGGLDLEGTYLWCALSCYPPNIFKITTAGSIVDSLSAIPSNTRPYGVAWDGQYLWTTNYTNDYIYKWADVTAVGPASLGKVKAVCR